MLYDLSSSLGQRRREYATAILDAMQEQTDLFAPFTLGEALASNADITPLDTCLTWPVPLAAYPQEYPLPENQMFPPVPTLILSGDLDSVASPEEAAQAASQFPNVEHIIVPNLTHVTAFSDQDNNIVAGGGDLTHCVSTIVRHFLDSLDTGDTTCVGGVRPIRTVPRFVRQTLDLDPPTPMAGNTAAPTDLKLASGAAEAVGDAIARFFVGYNGVGSGLRGGQVTYTLDGNGYDYVLDEVRWSDDLSVTGTIRWDQATGNITAKVQLVQWEHAAGVLDITWNDTRANAVATLEGTVHGLELRASRIAP